MHISKLEVKGMLSSKSREKKKIGPKRAKIAFARN